ncbi:Oligoribonuclease, mitochondrial, partial [Mortierella antarctica]
RKVRYDVQYPREPTLTSRSVQEIEAHIQSIECPQAQEGDQTPAWQALTASIQAHVVSILQVQRHLRLFYRTGLYKSKAFTHKQAKQATKNMAVDRIISATGLTGKWRPGTGPRPILVVGDGSFGTKRGVVRCQEFISLLKGSSALQLPAVNATAWGRWKNGQSNVPGVVSREQRPKRRDQSRRRGFEADKRAPVASLVTARKLKRRVATAAEPARAMVSGELARSIKNFDDLYIYGHERQTWFNPVDPVDQLTQLTRQALTYTQSRSWDCEMTGLLATDKLIEIAVIVTDDDLNIVAESGLTAAVLASTISTAQACEQVLAFIKEHIPTPRVGILAGNSVHADKVFLEREMPAIVDHLHYRIVDVSTVKELSRRWYPEAFTRVPEKMGAHRALDDIKESIQELQYYRGAVFK